jgi:hypothetical protein
MPEAVVQSAGSPPSTPLVLRSTGFLRPIGDRGTLVRLGTAKAVRDKRPVPPRTPWFVSLLGGISGAVLSILALYWLLHGAGGDGMTWFAGGFVFLAVGIPAGGAVAHIVWHRLPGRESSGL